MNSLKLICIDVGEEEGEVNYEEGMQFTPFNMREELQEGHFDQEGMYIPNKEKVCVCQTCYL